MESFQDEKIDKLVSRYFKLVSGLQRGRRGVVKSLMDLWQIDGVFEIAGGNPEKAIYEGQMAIHSFYKCRFTATVNKNSFPRINTRIVNMERDTRGVRVKWMSAINIDHGKPVSLYGSHLFNLKDGKINNLLVEISQPLRTSADECPSNSGRTVETNQLHFAISLIV